MKLTWTRESQDDMTGFHNVFYENYISSFPEPHVSNGELLVWKQNANIQQVVTVIHADYDNHQMEVFADEKMITLYNMQQNTGYTLERIKEAE